MIFFTSDTHFNHFNIIRFSNRPFYSVEEMDEILIQNWNNVVGKDDTIYHLGDFCLGDSKKYLKRLNGNIVRIKGSHDRDMKSPYMKIIQPEGLKDEYDNQRSIILCHYPMRSWHLSHYASFMLFGHHHGNLDPHGLSFDVGVDTNDFYPYSLNDIENKMKTLKPIVDFRKG